MTTWQDIEALIEPGFYTGVGSRETPPEVCDRMTRAARYLADRGMTLRSGAAEGADQAFEAGAGAKEIYLPWRAFQSHKSTLYRQSEEAMELAAKFHPAWDALKMPVKRLMSRNVYQVLGLDLETPSRFVICWTKDGGASGGTGQAIRVAQAYNIPVLNLKEKI